MKSALPQALRRLLTLVILPSATLVSAWAQTAPSAPPDATTTTTAPTETLPGVVVSASRAPENANLVPSSVTVLTPDQLDLSQVPDLRTALSQAPGVTVVNTGAPGGQSSVSIRGASSNETLFFVDGIRMNTESAADSYNTFLGGADLSGLDRIEILRGPQSTLYGSSAMGGVIVIDTARGAGPFSGVIDGTVGSFGTVGSLVAVQGGAGALGYSASIANEYTNNSRPDNMWDQWSYSTRLEYKVSDILTIGTTYRAQDGSYQEPGSDLPGDGDLGDVKSQNYLVTAYAEWQPNPEFQSRLTLGWTQTEYNWTDLSFGPSSDFGSLGTREILDWQNTWQATPWIEVVGGINAERSNYLASDQFTTDALNSVYLNTVMHPVKNLEFTLGGRGDHYDTVGDSVTWRTGAAYLMNDGTTKLHATYGTGFNAPDPVFALGQTPFFLPNPGIKPEQSRGWDAGIDQELFDHEAKVGITYFNNNFHNLFVYEFAGASGEEVNEARAETQGVEVEATAKLGDRAQLRVSYTYLSGGDPDTGTPLSLLPRHTIDAEVRVQATPAWLVGAGVHSAIDREFVSFGSTSGTPIEDYATVRLFTSYEVRKDLLVKLRVENAFNDKYEENPGWPALPFGIFGSVEWRF